MIGLGDEYRLAQAQMLRAEAFQRALRELRTAADPHAVVQRLRADYDKAWVQYEKPVRDHVAEIRQGWVDRQAAKAGGGAA